jgi:hypothetical protein
MKSKRKQIQEKLIKFATRIPVFMYLTDYRERCLKDVITQLEPGLFKKVTGLNVEDFNLLCSLGVFNAPLMNDAIFKFKRYEDASLSYTGINRHANDEVGGWDTTIRKAEYEKLFYNQQSSMTDIDATAYLPKVEAVEVKRVEVKPIESKPTVLTTEVKPIQKEQTVQAIQPQSVEQMRKEAIEKLKELPPEKAQELIELVMKLDSLEVNSIVYHDKFGKGNVTKINKNEKFIYVKFDFGGEKKFIFPDAFSMGFLKFEK